MVFNSRYLTDIASQIENEQIVLYLKDSGSPVMIRDMSDKNSFYVVMPMKIWFPSKKNEFKIFIFAHPNNHLIPAIIWFNLRNILAKKITFCTISLKKMLK